MLPDKMCAMLLTGHGGPEKLVYRDDVPLPAPAAGEVLLRVTACGLNNTDIWTREGSYGSEDDPDAVASFQRGESTLVFPRIQGADIVGRIAAVGAGVNPARIGERVMVDFNIYNGGTAQRRDLDPARMDYIGNGRDGGFADFATVPADQARRVDSAKSDIELATFCCAAMTAEHMISRIRLRAGERVLVTGASGGVGSAALQLSRIRGAIPYAVSVPEKQSALLEIGAEAVVSRRAEDLTGAITEATGGAALDAVVDVVAGPAFNSLLSALRPGGRYIACGAMADPLVEMDLRTVYLKHLEIHGSSQGDRDDFDRLVGYIESGRLKALVGGVYRLSELRRAEADFLKKSFVGKLVVVPDGEWTAGKRAQDST